MQRSDLFFLNFRRLLGVFLVTCLLVGGLKPNVWARDCRPIAEIGPSLDAGKAPLNTRVWIRLAPGNAHQFRRKGGKLSVAKLMRAIALTDVSTGRSMKFMLRVDADAGADIVLSLRPMATFRPDQRYRVELTLSKSWKVVNVFETGAKPQKAKNPDRGDVQVDHTKQAWDDQTLRVRYQVAKNRRAAPLYQVFVGLVGKARPKKPTTIEFTEVLEDAWSVDVIARDKCKGRLIPSGKRDILTWLRPLTWYGSAMGPIVGPFRLKRTSNSGK